MYDGCLIIVVYMWNVWKIFVCIGCIYMFGKFVVYQKIDVVVIIVFVYEVVVDVCVVGWVDEYVVISY